MENKKPENPTAFPTTKPLDGWGDPNKGMTLRDYFANSAMQSFVKVWYEDAKNNPDSIAIKSYRIADEMLKQREL